jgi:hypothetical protein
MSLSVITRPTGLYSSGNVKNITGVINATTISNSALIVCPAHGFSDGLYVYIKTNVENYNGFFIVETGGIGDPTNSFLLQYPGVGNYVSYINNATGVATGMFGHNWHCVHLPLLYKISNTLWPVNSADTLRTISSVTDSNGYCNITASGDIKATGSAAVLEFVKITGSTDSSLNKVWQIIIYSSDTSFILNIPYSAANDTALTNASIQYYYNNYNVRVKVHGGLPDGHHFESQRPYTEISELKISPGSDNISAFSVADIIKSQIITDNNTLLGTLPNNINNWTAFYIEYAEAYDVSTGGVLVNTVGSYTSDKTSLEGYAVNAILPFKNVYSGAMSEYVSGNSSQKFLTLFDEPVIFPGKYFDIGFIWDKTTVPDPLLSTFINGVDTGTSWTLSATPNVTLTGAAAQSKQLRAPMSNINDASKFYIINVSITLTAGATDPAIDIGFLNSSFAFVGSSNVRLSVGTFTYSVTIAGHANAAYFYLEASADVGGSANWQINSYTVDDNSLVFLRETYFISTVEQDTITTQIANFDSGVYRIQLTQPSCAHSTVNATLLNAGEFSTTPPNQWTDDAAWTSKTLTQFNLTDAVWPPGPSGSHTNLATTSGQKIKFQVTATLTGTVNGSIGFSFYLFYSGIGGGIRSNIVECLLTTAQSPKTFNIELTSTGTSDEIYLSAGLINGSTGTSGTVNLTLTMPSSYILVSTNKISETKTIKIDCSCAMPQAEGGMVLSWLNYLGGYDHWFFTTEQEKQINILETATTDDNIFTSWPNSYGESARGITRQTYRKAKNRIKLTSQLCTLEQLKGLQYIRTSPVVTITNSIYDTRVIIIDDESYTLYTQGDKQYFITFYAEFTDLIPSQRR